jgi:hypothetical protein
LDRLRQDGHIVRFDGKKYLVESNSTSLRNTVLFRTILHEVGHYVDWTQSINKSIAAADPLEEARIDREHDTKPMLTKENFAHQYAGSMAEELRKNGKIPFADDARQEDLLRDNLKPQWFSERMA